MPTISKEESQKDWKRHDRAIWQKNAHLPKAVCAYHRPAAKLYFSIRIKDSKKLHHNHQRRMGEGAVICSDS